MLCANCSTDMTKMTLQVHQGAPVEIDLCTACQAEIEELRQNVQAVNCSNCGAPIDLMSASTCTHCGSPVSMLDMKQPQELLNQLKQAAEPRPIDPALPLELAHAKREVDRWFGPQALDADWWSDASTSGVVEAGLKAVTRLLKRSGI